MNKKKFLLIGGAGFIGRNLIEKINIKKTEVHILDLTEKINHFFKNSNKFKTYKGDISDPQTFEKIKVKFDKVFFLAAETSTFLCEKNPPKCISTNILGITNFSKWCINFKPKEVIFSSSMAVYGVTAANVKETNKPKPISNYGISKLIGEKIILQLREFKIKIKIFRLFNVYGPGQDYKNLDQGMLSIYLIQALTKKKILIKGSVNRYRDFIFIDDVCKIMLSDFKVEKNPIYNLGFGKKIIVRYLIKLIFKNLNLNYNVKNIGSHSGDTHGSYANIDKIKKKGFKFKHNLEEGLIKTIKNLKGNNEYSRYFDR